MHVLAGLVIRAATQATAAVTYGVGFVLQAGSPAVRTIVGAAAAAAGRAAGKTG